VGALKTFSYRHFSNARSHDEAADIILLSALDRRHEIGHCHVRTTIALAQLLAQREEGGKFLLPAFIGEKTNIVPYRIGWPEADDSFRREPFFVDDLFQHGLRIGPE